MAILATLLFEPRREQPFLGGKFVHEILSSIVAQIEFDHHLCRLSRSAIRHASAAVMAVLNKLIDPRALD
jgi:hypothetical protein